MKISIVTSVKNGMPYLREAMASVRAQTHEDWEQLVIDAGSNDGGREFLESAAAEDRRIRCFFREGEPLYRSLSWGLSQCEGEMLAWLNADDLYPPWSFSTLCEFIEQTRAEWVTGFPACWDDKGALRFVRPRGWHPVRFIRSGMFHLNALGFLQQESMFFSRRLFSGLTEAEREAFAAQRFAGDFFLWKTFAKYVSLSTAPAVLGGFRMHDGNMSSRHMDDYMDEVRALGGWFPPRPFGAMAARAYNAASALAALRAVRRAEQSFAGNRA